VEVLSAVFVTAYDVLVNRVRDRVALIIRWPLHGAGIAIRVAADVSHFTTFVPWGLPTWANA
jgi:hypothetical protein